MNKRKVMLPVVASLITVLVLSGVSYAYYSANIKDVNKTETVIKSNVLGLEYTGVKDINVSDIVPGDVLLKTFTVKNISNKEVKYNIYMDDIINEFNEDLVYTLLDDSGEVVSETKLPDTSIKKYLKTQISINANETKIYKLKIEFKYTDKDQSSLQGKTFKGTLGIDTLETELKKSENNLAKVSDVTDNTSSTGTIKIINNTATTQIYSLMLSDLVDISDISAGYNYTLEKNQVKVKNDTKLPTTDEALLTNQKIESNQVDTYNITISKIKPIGVSFAEDSWRTIQKAIASGNYPYKVGDTKQVTLENFGTYTVRVANTTACTGAISQSSCGFIIEFVDIITMHNMNSTATNQTGWPTSELRTYLNDTLYNSMPADLQRVIASTSVITGEGKGPLTTGGSSSSKTSSIDKLYLLSTKEVWNGGTGYDSMEKYTRQLDYYKNLGVTLTNYKNAIKKYNGKNNMWWLRTAYSTSTTNFFIVHSNGRNYDISAQGSCGVSPAFRIE